MFSSQESQKGPALEEDFAPRIDKKEDLEAEIGQKI